MRSGGVDELRLLRCAQDDNVPATADASRPGAAPDWLRSQRNEPWARCARRGEVRAETNQRYWRWARGGSGRANPDERRGGSTGLGDAGHERDDPWGGSTGFGGAWLERDQRRRRCAWAESLRANTTERCGHCARADRVRAFMMKGAP
jgi:hypothetical protein